jgi:hypothetical protein
MSSNVETLTVQLPTQAVERLRQVANMSRRSVDDVIADTLSVTLPPMLESLPLQFQAELRILETLSSPELREQVQAQLPDTVVERYDELLAQNAAGQLSKADLVELDSLRQRADLLMYRKAYAALILKWRGEVVPQPILST